LYRGDEPVADPRNRLDRKARSVRRLARLRHASADRVFTNYSAAPAQVDEVVATEDGAITASERDQQLRHARFEHASLAADVEHPARRSKRRFADTKVGFTSQLDFIQRLALCPFQHAGPPTAVEGCNLHQFDLEPMRSAMDRSA